jgi:transglycosylase-like protein with SLT domain
MPPLLKRILALRTRMPKRLLAGRSRAAYVTMTAAALGIAVPAWIVAARGATPTFPNTTPPGSDAAKIIEARRRADFAAMQTFRPGYEFWRHVFTLPDGSIAFGSAVDGRLLATFPVRGDWTRQAIWADPTLAGTLDGQHLARKLGERRDQVAELLKRAVGPVLQNSTRGDALLRSEPRYGSFVTEWSAIYERFGVPPDIGLAQVILESGFNGTRRSEANAVGFCQWLRNNWKRLNYFSPTPIEERNQTSQAPYCAAYLSVLATKYGSFIPALSEHNAGGTNVGRALINGEHLGAQDVRARYFLGSKLARDLRTLPSKEYEDVYYSYGPRSYLYAEMVFGNTFTVRRLVASIPQEPIHAMRTPRVISLADIVKRTGLTPTEVQRFNPALTARLQAGDTLYLPYYVSGFGPDVAFWHRPPNSSYLTVLDDFMRLDAGAEQWDDPAFAPVLADFRRRFRNTNTEEGAVMDTVLAYVMDQAYTSGRRTLLSDFRRDDKVQRLIERGIRQLDILHMQGPVAAATF